VWFSTRSVSASDREMGRGILYIAGIYGMRGRPMLLDSLSPVFNGVQRDR
jgi:hypothetical protein